MKRLLQFITVAALLAAVALLGPGCATFTTQQTDISYDPETGKPIRTVSTRATARTFFEAKSSLASFKATQTDKTQSATVGSLSQEATGSNAVNVVQAVTEAAVRAALQP